jgi:maltose/moltooligosaccharide transporter
MVVDFHHMPKTMKQLAIVQFFTWFALFSMWIYMTPALTKYIYKITDTTSPEYNDAADWVNVLFAIYSGTAAIVAWGLPWFARVTNRRITHLIALCCGGAGLIAVFFVTSGELLIIPMIGVGIAWASILSMPYAILSSSLPASKMGYYMGVFNFFVVIPQIVAASILGFLVKHLFDGQSIYAFLIGGISMIAAGLLTLTVEDRDELR